MRATLSNLRGVRSESGMRIENSRSSPATKSARANESSKPDSKRDSSGEGLMGFPANCRSTSTILIWSFMRNLLPGRGPGLLISFEQLHQIGEQHTGETVIAGDSEVDAIVLRQPGRLPRAHGAGAAHAFARVPI